MSSKDNQSTASASSSASSSALSIPLRGSAETVTEFVHYVVNSILYQRGVYPPESFKRIPKYGLTMHLTTDDAILGYMERIEQQLQRKFYRSIFRMF